MFACVSGCVCVFVCVLVFKSVHVFINLFVHVCVICSFYFGYICLVLFLPLF